MTLKVYLAGPYAARDTLAQYAKELEAIGFHVTSRWLTETHEITTGTAGAAKDLDDAQVHQHAVGDLEDIGKADFLVAFTAKAVGLDALWGGSGGRHVETGYALALRKHVLVVGEPENVFHRMSNVDRCPDWHTALIGLAAGLVGYERGLPRAAEDAA